MKYRLTEDWLEYKKGDTFDGYELGRLVSSTLASKHINDISFSLLLKTGILEEVKEEEWPEDGKWYWSIDEGGEVFQAQFNGNIMPKKRSSFGNVFRSETEAKEASEKIKTLLLSLKK